MGIKNGEFSRDFLAVSSIFIIHPKKALVFPLNSHFSASKNPGFSYCTNGFFRICRKTPIKKVPPKKRVLLSEHSEPKDLRTDIVPRFLDSASLHWQ